MSNSYQDDATRAAAVATMQAQTSDAQAAVADGVDAIGDGVARVAYAHIVAALPGKANP